MTTTRHYIYMLIDPREDTPFYVGQTAQPIIERLYEHLEFQRPNVTNSERCQQIKDIVGSGYSPIICEIDRFDTIDKRFVDDLETQWINYMVEIGHDLANVKNNYLKTYGYRLAGFDHHIADLHLFEGRHYDEYDVYTRTPR